MAPDVLQEEVELIDLNRLRYHPTPFCITHNVTCLLMPRHCYHGLVQEETIRELTAALEAKGAEMEASRKQAAAEADAAVLERMQA